MPVYILLSTLTDVGADTVRANPERIREVGEEVARMGLTVRAQYATLGAYDFVSIVEAPDNETAMRVSLALAARGTVRIHTLPAIEVGTLIDRLKLAKAEKEYVY